MNTIDTTTAVATTNGFRVLDPYKMDSFFKNNGSIDSENNTKKAKNHQLTLVLRQAMTPESRKFHQVKVYEHVFVM